jgi:hypothetical protein
MQPQRGPLWKRSGATFISAFTGKLSDAGELVGTWGLKAKQCLDLVSAQWDAAAARLRAFVEEQP